MMQMLPVLLKDGYKVGHKFQYPKNTTLVYSNFTPRGSRRENGLGAVIAFGYQYFAMEYLQRQFRERFFNEPKDTVVAQYKRRIDNYLGPGTDVSHIADLHDLGYLPLKMKAVPEGTLVPLRVPTLTVRNTKSEFYWLTNMLETLLSNVLWQAPTSATTAFMYRKRFEAYAQETGAPKDFVKWQGHDFSFRGMSGVEAACLSGAAHLLSFTGTDTITAIDFLEAYYGANCEKELIGGSVPATEHSVMSMGGQESEIDTIYRLITETYPKGIISIVWDTWDFWKGLNEHLPALREVILKRDGKVVVRPDSGDPVKIICGDSESPRECVKKGAIQCLWDVFGGRINEAGYKELDPHIGLIYGDSITLERQEAILGGLKAKGFASSNVVLGIGSYTYQHVTRDTDGWAMKATYGERCLTPAVNGGHAIMECQAIFKKPATDDGTKNSAKGLLRVCDEPLPLHVHEDCSWEEENWGNLQTVFEDGELKRFETLAQIRARVESYL
jgi:nicotinamide phosphoribosyltransferase